MATQAPVKVSEATREKIRYAAALSEMTQTRLVEAAVDEYLARHADELDQGIARARTALRLGDDAAVTHLLGADAETARRVGARPHR
jgi:predicted transcriptional regulator